MSDQGVRRVALVLGTSAGGVGRHVRMLAERLAGDGRQVVVAGPRATEDAFDFTGAGARFAAVPIADRPRPLADLGAVLRLRNAVRGADAVHAHGLRAGAFAALALAGTGRRARLVVTLHNAVTAGGATGAIYGVLERIVARRADRVLVVSPDLGDRMRARGARRIDAAVVPAPPLARPSRSPEDVRRELAERAAGFTGDRPVVLTIARLAQQKGLEALLDAAAGPYAARPLFVVAGDGPLRRQIQERIDAERLPVLLYGWAAPADLLQVADALLVPSRWEGQPLSVQEALKAGTPIIATRVGGIPDLVGDAAVLVPEGNAAAMRGELDRLLGDHALLKALAERSARRGRELPGEEDALHAVLRAYSEHAG
ncbi:glycosyltransferase family 4 protein [Microtetraspora sp. NBRC 16547]|uniref:glycosyltransferase family 4 protein n=1 Tax=Microtetraspora sp. NBRC 16547 TaxID=3030993 RepID=UPI0024A4ED4E|nr:glycosyltransferase family 4 protein [Microtetraspora sp. NBRC 16547]GLW99829.1 glycosyl transferase [Microtetraspora sp. NBRC 16547]